MLLKGNASQVSFLHVYHHVSISCIWWAIAHAAPGGDGAPRLPAPARRPRLQGPCVCASMRRHAPLARCRARHAVQAGWHARLWRAAAERACACMRTCLPCCAAGCPARGAEPRVSGSQRLSTAWQRTVRMCACARSLVQRVPELAGARVHVRVLLCGDRAGRQRGRAPALPVVGPLPHPVPGAPGPAAAAPRLSTSWSRRGSRLLRTRAMGGQARGGRPDLVKPGARARGV